MSCRTRRRCPIPDDPCEPGQRCWETPAGVTAAPAPAPEGVYRAAAEANVRTLFAGERVWSNGERVPYPPEVIEQTAHNHAQTPSFRAAVDAAYAAGRKDGYGQGRDDEANGEDLPEWYRLATGEICRPGQPFACGDFHHNGHCVRERHDG